MAGYLKAWETDDPDDIAALFAEDATYYTSPDDPHPVTGREAIVAWWIAEEEDTIPEFEWTLLGVTDDRAFIEGRTVYPEFVTYRNLWVVDFAPDGRAKRFVEWYMEES